jgi:hypothetical protein
MGRARAALGADARGGVRAARGRAQVEDHGELGKRVCGALVAHR